MNFQFSLSNTEHLTENVLTVTSSIYNDDKLTYHRVYKQCWSLVVNIATTRGSRFFCNDSTTIQNVYAASPCWNVYRYVINFHNRVPEPDTYNWWPFIAAKWSHLLFIVILTTKNGSNQQNARNSPENANNDPQSLQANFTWKYNFAIFNERICEFINVPICCTVSQNKTCTLRLTSITS